MFLDLKRQVRANFDKMAESNDVLFYVDIDKDTIWDKYLLSFEAIDQQGHNCNSCKSFLRQYAGVVAIVDNKRISIWDDVTPPDEYKASIDSIREYIKGMPITNIFLNPFSNCGTDKNHDKERNVDWDHFYFKAPSKFLVKEKDYDSKRGSYREVRNLFKRGLDTITMDAIETTIELIEQGSIYRGTEFLGVVKVFKDVLEKYNLLETEEVKEYFTWKELNNTPHTARSIRNSAIGTLLVDLSEMKGLDASVASFEAKVAPTNYKRTTALATPAMIKQAKEKLIELGMLDSLGRKYATSTDLNLDNLLFIDKSSELIDPFEELTKEAKGSVIHPKEFSKVEEITIEKFINDVLPSAKSVELYLQPDHFPKMMSLVTAENPNAPTLFKWSNVFSWSYTGGITDSIKERVKAAGGQTVGELRVSLSWNNFDDLDLHVLCPDKTHIYYSTYRAPARANNGGQLDVDENAGSGRTRTPVENIIFPDKKSMPEGKYIVSVHQFSLRETKDSGYVVQVEHEGQITDFPVEKSPSKSRPIDDVVIIDYSKTKGISFNKTPSDSKISVKEKWGLKTHSFVKVKQMFLSPNYWGTNNIGNKHYMFALEGCLSDEAPKPFFNEFLNNTFTENRKTFEMLIDKYPVVSSKEQISGLGFSETLPGEVILRVEGKFKRLLKIKF